MREPIDKLCYSDHATKDCESWITFAFGSWCILLKSLGYYDQLPMYRIMMVRDDPMMDLFCLIEPAGPIGSAH